MKKFLSVFLFLTPIVARSILAQEHIPVPLADASRPVSLTIILHHGGVTVRGYDGHEILVDTKSGTSGDNLKTHDGLHRIGGVNDLNIESDNNKVTISSNGGHYEELTVQTPLNTSLNVKTFSGGEMTIENVAGEIVAQGMNGAVTIHNASAPVVASSLNGGVTVTMSSVKSGSPMSFSSLNGNVDVTLPANIAANFKMKTNHGDIYSDFDVKLQPQSAPVGTKDAKGKYKLKVDGGMTGTVNGGGPEYRFETLNGNIYIRKKLN